MGRVYLAVAVLVLAHDVRAAEPAPVAHYTFDKGRGDVVRDITGNGHDGTILGGAKRTRGALMLDGEDDYVEVAPKIGRGLARAGTVEIWCRPTALQGGLVNWSTGSGWNDERLVMAINTYHGKEEYLVVFSDSTYPQMIRKFGKLEPNRWTHIALTWDAHEIRGYQDGVQVRSTSRRITAKIDDVPMWIGRCQGLGKGYFKGLIDEVRVYAEALDSTQIVQQFKQKAKRRGMKAARYFNMPKLTLSQRPGPGWITAEADYGWMQPLPPDARVQISLADHDRAEHDVANHLRIGRVTLDASALAPGNYSVKAQVVDGSGKPIGKPASATIQWQGRDPAFDGIKVLNNLVWELLNETRAGTFTIRQPRYRWVWIKAEGDKVAVKLNGKAVLNAAGETMRRLDDGEHQVQASGGV